MKEAYFTGKDLYATMASEIYKMPYADCMEFYLDENGEKTDVTNPEGKTRRSRTKSVLLGILYRKGYSICCRTNRKYNRRSTKDNR